MKSIRNIAVLFVSLFLYLAGFSQKKVVLEQIQVYSTIQPTANYWQVPNDITAIQKALDSGIFKDLNLTRDEHFTPTIQTLSKQSQIGKIAINWGASRNIPYHAYLELYELDPSTLQLNKEIKLSEQKKDSLHSVWAIVVDIFNDKHEYFFQKNILLGILTEQNLGIGKIAYFLPSTPSNLYQAITKSIQYISRETNNWDYMEAKMPNAFFADNYWMPLLHLQPRANFDTSKTFVSYPSASGIQLLRIPPASLIKLDLKNTSVNYPFINYINKIKNSRLYANRNEYYHVLQELRDVHANKDYSIEAYLEFNKNNSEDYPNGAGQSLIFLDEMGNQIMEGKDIVGKFHVKEMEIEKDKFYYPNKVYNGYDSSKQYEVQTYKQPMQIVHSRVITGNIYNYSFKIQYDNEQSLITILVDEKVVMILDGFPKPRQMVQVSNSLELPMKNLLILIAYAELFQSPN